MGDKYLAESEVAKLLIESGAQMEDPTKGKPLKKARSEAELTRVRQGWVLIFFAASNLLVALLLLAIQLGIIRA